VSNSGPDLDIHAFRDGGWHINIKTRSAQLTTKDNIGTYLKDVLSISMKG
jgi:hypothetical protein